MVPPGAAAVPTAAATASASPSTSDGRTAPTVSRMPASLASRYRRPVRIGPAVATADVRAGLGRVEVRDAGGGDRLAVVATTRTFGMAHRAA